MRGGAPYIYRYTYIYRDNGKEHGNYYDWLYTQRVQSTYMVQSMVSVVVISLMVLGKCSPYGYLGPFGIGIMEKKMETTMIGYIGVIYTAQRFCLR